MYLESEDWADVLDVDIKKIIGQSSEPIWAETCISHSSELLTFRSHFRLRSRSLGGKHW